MSGSATGRVHVFVGPSLPRAEVARLAPTAVIHPPVAHGDLLRLPVNRGDTIVLIDGVFQQVASVRHKEILAVLAEGARVLGGASMGALRAAELGPFGMTGHGLVHRLYTTGILEADDEVALLHDDDGDYTARTVAKVSLRVLARRLRVRGAVTTDDERLLLATAEQLPFTTRALAAVLATARRNGLPDTVADHLTRLTRAPATQWDVKAQDAVRVVRAATSNPPPPSVLPDWTVTGYLARWQDPPDGQVSMLVTAAQLYAEDYPELHYRTLLAAIAGQPDDLPLRTLEENAVAAARARGLLPTGHRDHTPPYLAPWLDPDERYPDPVRLWSKVLVRSYRWPPSLAPLPLLHKAIQATPQIDELQQIVAQAEHLNAQLRRRGHSVESISTSAVERTCLRRWQCSSLWPAAFDHGFIGPHDLRRRARPLCAYGLLHTPQPVRLLGQPPVDPH